jgi:4-amino-4-deoxychorismate lyase
MSDLLAVAAGGRGIVPLDEPVLRADDEALLRGRAAFETLRVYNGRPFRFDEHLARLTASAERIGLPPVDEAELRSLAAQALEEAGADEAALRLYWTPAPTALALVSSVPDYDELRRRGQRLVSLPLGVTPDLRREAPWLLGGVKSTSYAVNVVAEAEARRRGADDAVFVRDDRVVLEGPVTNVWWRRGRTLYTPSLELGILAGVTRAVLIEAAPAVGYEVVQGAFALAELLDAEEVFTSSSVREILPVVEVDGRRFDRGPAASELQRRLREEAGVG